MKTIEEIKAKIEMLKALAIVVKGTSIEEDVEELLKKYDDEINTKQTSVFYKGCYISRDDRYGKYKIHKGGYIAASLSNSTSPSIRETWENLKKEGYVDENGLILKDISGYSASTTVSIIAGCNMSGPKVLKDLIW